jgi:hypothetical protein
MAYVNLTKVTCANKKEFFCRMRDFICKRNGTYDYSTTGIGWTLFDSSYAVDEDNPAVNDYFVIYSPGEDGKQDIFIKVSWILNLIRIQSCLTWNPTTHTSTTLTAAATFLAVTDAMALYALWVYGDLDACLIVNTLTTNITQTGYFGKLNPVIAHITGETAICSSALSIGTDVSITVDSAPSHWKIGRALFIRTTHTDNITTSKVEKIIIKTISGNTFTCDLTNAYTANSKITDIIGYCVSSGSYLFTTVYMFMGNSGALANCTGIAGNSIVQTSRDPDGLESEYLVTDGFVSLADGVQGKYKNLYASPALPANEDILAFEDGTNYRFHLGTNVGYNIVSREV